MRKRIGKLVAAVRRVPDFLRSHIRLDPFPLRHQLMGYSFASLRADFHAGLNVALLAFPQGMAYAMLAKLPIQYGVYASAIASMVAPLFSRCSLMVIGPTNATAVMLLSVFLSLPPEIDRLTATAVIVFLMAVFLILGAFLQVATLLKFISRSVIIGYLTGAALLIIANQLHHAIGTKIADASTMLDLFVATIRSLPETNWAALLIAAFTIAAIYALRHTGKRLPDSAIALVFSSLVGAGLLALGAELPMVSAMPGADWKFTPPTLNSQWLFLLTGPALAIGFIAAMESTVMSKTLSSRTGTTTNPNQEMLSLGIANLAGGLFSGMPSSGSLTRSALNGQSGAVTGISSIFSGLICASAALLLGPLTAYIPKAALAALVITVALSLIDFRRIKVALRATKSDAVVVLVTFVAAMFTPLDFAIFLGVGVSIALFLHKVSTPRLVEYAFNEEGNLGERADRREDPHIAIIHVEGELFFGASDLFREELSRVAADPDLRVLILRMRNAHHLDATSILALEELILSMQKSGRHIIMSGASREVFKIMRNTGVLDVLGRENFFMASPSNPNLATRNALKRAQVLLGDQKVEIRIYHDPTKSKKQEAK